MRYNRYHSLPLSVILQSDMFLPITLCMYVILRLDMFFLSQSVPICHSLFRCVFIYHTVHMTFFLEICLLSVIVYPCHSSFRYVYICHTVHISHSSFRYVFISHIVYICHSWSVFIYHSLSLTVIAYSHMFLSTRVHFYHLLFASVFIPAYPVL